ncbi:MAG: DUF4174 domain-containing protein [Gammaproteobacteria bacterium]
MPNWMSIMALAALLALPGGAASAATPADNGLPKSVEALMEGFSWNTRPMVVFAPDAASPKLATLRQDWALNEGEWLNRSMAMLEVRGLEAVYWNGQRLAIPAAEMHRYFAVEEGVFAILLVGYDGEVKERSQDPEILRALFGLIDTMPIRQMEMRDSD